MAVVVNTARHPIDLHDGRMLAPGERADVELTDHEHHLVDDGLLLEADDKPKSRRGGRDQED